MEDTKLEIETSEKPKRRDVTKVVSGGGDGPITAAPPVYVSMEAELLRTAANRDAFQEFKAILSDKLLLPEAAAILTDVGAWYEANPAVVDLDWSAFLGWARVACRATMKPDKWDVYQTIAKNAAAMPCPNPAILGRYRELKALAAIRAKVDAALASHNPKALDEIIAEASSVTLTATAKRPELVTDNWDDLLSIVQRKDGLEWRLEDLNVAVGPIDRGDVVMIGKRPEVGGTTFLASEMSYMVPQLPPGKHGIIFTNEEVGAKVKMRVIQAALGLTLAEIASDPLTCKGVYEGLMAGRRIDIVHSTAITDQLVDQWLRSGEYGLIGVNVLDKVILTRATSEGAELKRDLGIWARSVADKYGAVIGVLQASVEAEGQKWPDQSCLYGSKTGLQAESDVLIMIGKTHNPSESDRRFIGVVRNKLPGGDRTSASERHGRFEVAFDGERGRFETLAYRAP